MKQKYFDKYEKIEQAVERFQQTRDESAFRYLIREYEGMLKKLVHSTDFAKTSAYSFEDYLQIARMHFYKAVLQYDKTRGLNFSHFARMYVRQKLNSFNKYLTRQRRDVNNEMLLDEEFEKIAFRDSVQDVADVYIEREQSQLLHEIARRVFNKLKRENDRKIFIMWFYKFMKSNEIAEQLGVCSSTVRMRIKVMKKMLQVEGQKILSKCS